MWIDSRVHNGLYGLSWESAAESRWHHAERLLQRFYVGAIGPRPIPQSMKVVQANLKADNSVEAQLLSLLRADAGNFSARNRLKLLRACQQLCPEASAQDVALHLIGSRFVDRVLFAHLGDGEEGPKN